MKSLFLQCSDAIGCVTGRAYVPPKNICFKTPWDVAILIVQCKWVGYSLN